MRKFITFVSFIVILVGTAHAQTTRSAILVDGQQYDVTFRNGVTFDAYETEISSNGSRDLSNNQIAAPWWNASPTAAQDFAQALYNANNADSNIRFAHKSANIFGTDAIYAATYDGSTLLTDVYAQNASSNYAISAVAVPAPLPILGILPVVGFLKRMRKRQRA